MGSTYEKEGRLKEIETATRKKNFISATLQSFIENMRYIKRKSSRKTNNSGIHCSAMIKKYGIWSASISNLKRQEIVKNVIAQVLKGNPPPQKKKSIYTLSCEQIRSFYINAFNKVSNLLIFSR